MNGNINSVTEENEPSDRYGWSGSTLAKSFAAFAIILVTALKAFAIEDTNVVAAGEWSKPVASGDGWTIRGRLLMCDTPDHASSEPRTDTAVYFELQEFSPFITPVRVFYGLDKTRSDDRSSGLNCELRDRQGKLVPQGAAFSGGTPGSYWVTLHPYCSARLRASVYGGGRREDGSLAIYLASAGSWDVRPNPTNEYYLSGTFTVPPPTNVFARVDQTNRGVWFGTLTLPSLKVPLKKP